MHGRCGPAGGRVALQKTDGGALFSPAQMLLLMALGSQRYSRECCHYPLDNVSSLYVVGADGLGRFV